MSGECLPYTVAVIISKRSLSPGGWLLEHLAETSEARFHLNLRRREDLPLYHLQIQLRNVLTKYQSLKYTHRIPLDRTQQLLHN